MFLNILLFPNHIYILSFFKIKYDDNNKLLIRLIFFSDFSCIIRY